MKTLVHPVTGKQIKFGRNRPTTPHCRTSLKDMMKAGVLPNVTVPHTTNYSGKSAASLHNIYANDTLGDCTIAGSAHAMGISGFNSGQGVIFTNEQIIADYSACSGYNPNAPLVNGQNPTDQGADEITVLNYYKNHGYADGVKLIDYVAVDATNISEVRLAMYLFENLYFGVELPDAWVNPFPAAGGRWDVAGAPDPSNGHCFVACDLVPNGVKVATWGYCLYLTNAAISYYAAPAQGGQLFVLLLPNTVSKLTQKSPAGYDINTLTNYLSQV